MGENINTGSERLATRQGTAVYSCLHTPGDIKRARDLVQTVKRHQKALILVGAALCELAQDDLWKALGAEHKTFKAFCHETFGFGRDYGYKLIRAYQVLQIWRKGVESGILKKEPISEASLRPFTTLRDSNGNLDEDLILKCAQYCEIQAGRNKPITQRITERAVSKHRQLAARKQEAQTPSAPAVYLRGIDRARQLLDHGCDTLRHLADIGSITEERRLAALAVLDRINDATAVHREKLLSVTSPEAPVLTEASPTQCRATLTEAAADDAAELLDGLEDNRRCLYCESRLSSNEDEQCHECQEEDSHMYVG